MTTDITKVAKESITGVIKDYIGNLKSGELVTENVVNIPPKQVEQKTDNVPQSIKTNHAALYREWVTTFNDSTNGLIAINKDDVIDTKLKKMTFKAMKDTNTVSANAAYLHELYFSNCFKHASEIYVDSLAYSRLARDFGTFSDWQKDFIASGLASTDNGWVVTGYSFFMKRYVTVIIDGNDANIPIGFVPVICLDMHAHAYFGAMTQHDYVIKTMGELNWETIEKRFTTIDEMIGE